MNFQISFLLLAILISTTIAQQYHPNHNYDVEDHVTKTPPSESPPAPPAAATTQPVKRENQLSGSTNQNRPRKRIFRRNENTNKLSPGSRRPTPGSVKRNYQSGPKRNYSPHLKDSFGGYGDVKKRPKYTRMPDARRRPVGYSRPRPEGYRPGTKGNKGPNRPGYGSQGSASSHQGYKGQRPHFRPGSLGPNSFRPNSLGPNGLGSGNGRPNQDSFGSNSHNFDNKPSFSSNGLSKPSFGSIGLPESSFDFNGQSNPSFGYNGHSKPSFSSNSLSKPSFSSNSVSKPENHFGFNGFTQPEYFGANGFIKPDPGPGYFGSNGLDYGFISSSLNNINSKPVPLPGKNPSIFGSGSTIDDGGANHYGGFGFADLGSESLGAASSEVGNYGSESHLSESYGGGGGGGKGKGDGEYAGRVKIKVFRGPTEKEGDKYYAPWGYYVSQPNDDGKKKGEYGVHGYS